MRNVPKGAIESVSATLRLHSAMARSLPELASHGIPSRAAEASFFNVVPKVRDYATKERTA